LTIGKRAPTVLRTYMTPSSSESIVRVSQAARR
jgi:hypothetical protein